MGTSAFQRLLFTATLVAASAASADEGKLGIAVLDLEVSANIEPSVAETLTALVAQHVKDTGAFDVIAQQDVRRLIGFEKMKVALTCDLDASCLVDIGQTLGVPFLLAGRIARLDEKVLLSLTLTDVTTPKVLGRELVEAENALTLGQQSALAIARLLAPVLEEHAGRVVLATVVEDLEVFLDGALQGRTPLPPVRATPGTHRLEVKRNGWRTFSKDIVIPVDGEHIVQVVMIPLPETHAALVRDAVIQTTVGASLATVALVAGTATGLALFALGEFFKSTLAHPLEGDPLGRSIIASETASSILVARGAGTFALLIGAALAIPLVGVALTAEWPAPLPAENE